MSQDPVHANGRTIVHAGDGLEHVSAFTAERHSAETVASCHTCQALLYLTMCGKDDRAC